MNLNMIDSLIYTLLYIWRGFKQKRRDDWPACPTGLGERLTQGSSNEGERPRRSGILICQAVPETFNQALNGEQRLGLSRSRVISRLCQALYAVYLHINKYTVETRHLFWMNQCDHLYHVYLKETNCVYHFCLDMGWWGSLAVKAFALHARSPCLILNMVWL